MNNPIIIFSIVIVIFLLIIKPKARRAKKITKYRREEPIFYYQKDDKSYFQNERIKQILNTNFKSRQLMNKAEYKVFCTLDKLLLDKHREQNYRLFVQVGLGGLIDPPKKLDDCTKEEREAFWAINHLRADFLIIDRFGKPVLVIEYQGAGHRMENSSDRDTRKRYACQKAGVDLVEVFEHSKEFECEKISLLLNAHYDKIAKNKIGVSLLN